MKSQRSSNKQLAKQFKAISDDFDSTLELVLKHIAIGARNRAKILRKQNMPLVKGAKAKTKKGFSENVKREMEAGRPQKQAVAIAYSEAGEKKKKK